MAASVLLAACGSDDGDDTSSSSGEVRSDNEPSFTPSDGPVQRGGTFVDHYTTASGWNPVSQEVEGRHTGARYSWDRLLTAREGERRYNLESAESVETPDPLTVIFKLKPNQFFHDIPPVNGRALTASDVVASQNYVKELPNAFDKVFANDFLERAESPDDLTVIYRLRKPAAYLFSGGMLGSGTGQSIMAPETFANLNTQINAGTGPFQLDPSSQLSVRHVYKRHPKFRDAGKNLPYVDGAEIIFIPDNAATEAAFRSGQIDRWVSPSPTQVTTIPKDMGAKARLLGFNGWASFSWNMNMEKPDLRFTDVRVREAFWRLTNPQQMLDLAYQGLGKIPAGLLPAGLEFWQLDRSEVQKYYNEDVQSAKQLLAAAQFDLDREFDCMGGQAGSATDSAAQVWKQQLIRAGIKINISNVAGTAQLFQRWSDNDWQLMIQGSPGTDTPGQALRNLHTKGWSDVFRRFGLFDPEIDALIEKSEAELNVEVNKQLVLDVQRKAIAKFSSFYQLLTPNTYWMYSGRVQNIELTQVTPVYQTGIWLKQA